MKKRFLLLSIALLICYSAWAKRGAPPKVEGIVQGNLVYDVDIAWDWNNYYWAGLLKITATGETPYSIFVPVYETKIDRFMEADVQFVFFRKMEFIDPDTIELVNEDGQVFHFDTASQKVECVSQKLNQEAVNRSYEKYLKNCLNQFKKIRANEKIEKEIKLDTIDSVVSYADQKLKEKYGTENVQDCLPYNVSRVKDFWIITTGHRRGTEDYIGYAIVIDSKNHKVVHISYVK